MKNANEPVVMSHQAIKRFPYYLKYLKQLNPEGGERVSASTMAADLKLYEVLVRKDLAAVSSIAGKPRVGFVVKDLIADIEDFLGYNNKDMAVLVGAGHLGKALLSYSGFDEYGLEIVAAFDCDRSVHGEHVGGREIFPMDKMDNLCARLNVRIGIISVPWSSAQAVCDLMIKSGIIAVWNFAPVHLNVPDNILVQNENMAVSLAILSKHLSGEA